MAVVIAAPSSGSGKTLLSLVLLAWARCRGHTIQPFKVGPDYLDPQLLGATAGRSCRNLDLTLCGEAEARAAEATPCPHAADTVDYQRMRSAACHE